MPTRSGLDRDSISPATTPIHSGTAIIQPTPALLSTPKMASKTDEGAKSTADQEPEEITIVGLARQMMTMAKTLEKTGQTMEAIDKNLTSLNLSVHNLELAKTELKDDFVTLRKDIKEDMITSRNEYDLKLAALENKITDDSKIKLSEIMVDLDAYNLTFTTSIEEIKANTATYTSTFDNLKDDSKRHDRIFNELRDMIQQKDERIDRLEAILMDHIKDTTSNFLKVDKKINIAIEMANQIEAHERRWAMRIMGLPSPTTVPESPKDIKAAILLFLLEKLDIKNVRPMDMDTAHRLGPIIDGKQTILVRFFRRQIVEDILMSKRMLKGKNMSLFQDTTRKNRTLIWNLTQRAEVEGAWCANGKIWAKLHGKTTKIRASITDDLDKLLSKKKTTKENNEDNDITDKSATTVQTPDITDPKTVNQEGNTSISAAESSERTPTLKEIAALSSQTSLPASTEPPPYEQMMENYEERETNEDPNTTLEKEIIPATEVENKADHKTENIPEKNGAPPSGDDKITDSALGNTSSS